MSSIIIFILNIQKMSIYCLQSQIQTVPITAKVFLVGRSKHAQLQINHPSISKDHAYLELRDHNRLFVKDMASLNGTRVNEQRLEKHEERQLKQNDLIEFGWYQYKFKVLKKGHSEDRNKDKKAQKRINLKDLFAQTDNVQTSDYMNGRKNKSKSKQKRINFNELDPVTFKQQDTKSVNSRSDNQRSQIKNRPKESKINMNNIDNFYRNKDISDFAQSPQISIPSKYSIEPYQTQTQIIQQNKTQTNNFAQLQRNKLEEQLTHQREYFQKKMQVERQKYINEKDQLCRQLKRLEIERQQEDRRYKQQQKQKERTTQNIIQTKKRQIDDKKKMLEMEAEIIGKQYQKIYKQSIQKIKNSLQRHQILQRQLQGKINEQRQNLQTISNKYKQQNATGQKLKLDLKQIQSKNKALLLYTNHLQQLEQNVQKSSKVSPQKGRTKQQSEVQVLRKLFHNRNQQISQLKRISKNLILQCSKDNLRQNYQFDILYKNTEKISQLKLQLFNYIDREKYINQQWEEEVKLNQQQGSKVKSMILRLKKNKEELQQIHVTNTKKICQYHNHFYKLLQKQSNPEKKKAGNFLVNQLVQIEQQRNQYQSNIEQLHLKIQEYIYFTLRQRAQTTKLSQLLFSKTQSRFSQLDVLHSKLQSLTQQVNYLQNDDQMKSLSHMGKQASNLEIQIIAMEQQQKRINETINSNFNYQETGKTALDFFSNLYSQKNQYDDQYSQQHKMLEQQIERLRSEYQLVNAQYSVLCKRYQKFKIHQLQEAHRLINS